MTSRKSAEPPRIQEALVRSVRDRLSENKRVRRTLPASGRVHIDRQLPFLCIYRSPTGRGDEGTRRLVLGSASYLIASGNRGLRPSLAKLVRGIVQTLSLEFGAFLIVEIWSRPDVDPREPESPGRRRPGFRIFVGSGRMPERTLTTLQRALGRIRVQGRKAEVEVSPDEKPAPPRMSPLLSPSEALALNCHQIGVEVRPIYRDPHTEEPYPLVRRELVHELTQALLQTFYQFARQETTHRPPHFHALGRKAVVKAVWEVDRKLAEVSQAFDFLLQVSPANPDAAWNEFRRRRFQKSPRFVYRPRSFDPALLKRSLWKIPIERTEDPTLADLFREKRSELDTQLSMLADLDTPRLLYGSLRAYGKPSAELVELSRSLLEKLSPRAREGGAKGSVDAERFAELAREEISRYRSRQPAFEASVFVRGDTTGLMVSGGNLLVGRSTKIPVSRVDALLQHELGTHVLTYYNGRAQPFRQLAGGLAGYEELQEGLAVLAEYLVGGLTRPRLRLLGGRVLAVHSLVEGATFVETFRELNRNWGFAQRVAFVATMRVYRGGGVTKDMAYLKGLVRLLEYLGKGGELEPLFVGKIAVDHIPIIRELQLRGVLQPAPFRPTYMERPETRRRLSRVRAGLSVLDLMEGSTE